MHAAGEAGDGKGKRLGGVADEGEAAGLLEGVDDERGATGVGGGDVPGAVEVAGGRSAREWLSPIGHLILIRVSH